MAKTIKCLKCQTDNSAEFAFCGTCGDTLKDMDATEGMMDCPKCNQKTPDKFYFCGHCGGLLHEDLNITTTKPKESRGKVSKLDVDRAFEKMGVDDKFLKEHDTTKEQILAEIGASTKPKEEAVISRDAGTIGGFGLGKPK